MNTILTNESNFVLGWNSKWVWINTNNITKKVLQKKKKQAHEPKIMIWGGIASNYKTFLLIFDDHINTKSYIDQIIFWSNMIESADRQFGVGNWTLLQDNARSHVSKETLTVLKELSVDVLPDFP